MHTLPSLDKYLSSHIVDPNIGNPVASDPLDTIVISDTEEEGIPVIVELPLAAGEIDPRLKLLSHSSRTLLHTCPRKYQLYRLSATEVPLADDKEIKQGVTFAYGHAVGTGVASTLEGKTEEQVIIDTFLAWDTDLLDDNVGPRSQNKSYWLAQFAVQKFLDMRTRGFLVDYELVWYEGKPATELGFQILLPDGFRYRGFVDAVLQHKTTKDIMVLECKTTSSTAQPAQYKNSGQAVGYSVVLDIMFPELSSYTVLYLVYESKSYSYKQLPFQKSLLQRALWLQELLIDTQIVSLYESYETYPLHGESCYDYFRDCEYLSLCTLATKNLTKPLTNKIVEKVEVEKGGYEFTVSFDELIQAQIAKAAPSE